MNDLIFDTSTIISIATNNLLDVLEQLKKKFKGDFIISNDVKREVLDHPLKTRKYKLEAIMISNLILNNVIRTYSNVNLERKTINLLNLCNNIFLPFSIKAPETRGFPCIFPCSLKTEKKPRLQAPYLCNKLFLD